MDWINEKIAQFQAWVRNASLKKAMIAYILILCAAVFLLSKVTMTVTFRWEVILSNPYLEENPKYEGTTGLSNIHEVMPKKESTIMQILDAIRIWCPLFYAFFGVVIMSSVFYKKRLRRPFEILQQGTQEIRKSNLDFNMSYDSKDEMGQLCDSFEEMRQELIHNKEEMWELVEKQKQLNAAFAHDLRTPLTVLKGYSDFLARYIPEGKISQEKMLDTLRLMSSHIERLEEYSRTMKGIHSIDEMPVRRVCTDILSVQRKLREVTMALNNAGEIQIKYTALMKEPRVVYIDDNIVMEVLENLLSNSIRYAGQTIEVETELSDANDTFMLTVRDDGPGFSEVDLRNAILPYYGADIREEHFGIGLHICSKLCEKHGGAFSIANSMNGGAIATGSFSCKEE